MIEQLPRFQQERERREVEDLNELRSIVRSLLSEVTVGQLKKGSTYSYRGETAKYTGFNDSTSQYNFSSDDGSVKFSVALTDLKNVTAGAAPAVAKPATGKPAFQPPDSDDFTALHRMLDSIYQKYPDQIDFGKSAFKYGKDTRIGPENILKSFNKIKSGSSARTATAGMLWAVCSFLGKRAQDPSTFEKLKDFITKDKEAFKADQWKDFLNSLFDSNKEIVPSMTAYLNALSRSGSRYRPSLEGFTAYIGDLADVQLASEPEKTLEAPAASTEEGLVDFLARISDKDADKIRKDTAITAAANTALQSFITKAEKLPIFVFDSVKPQVSAGIAALTSLKGVSDKEQILTKFKGPSILGYAFESTEKGLVDLLRFAYIATRAGREASGDDAAAKLGLSRDPKIRYVIPKDNIWYALGLTGAINSFPFMFIKNNTDTTYPANTRVKIGDVTSAEITSDLVKGIYLVVAIGLESGKSTVYDTKPVPAFIVGPDANRLLGMIGRSVEVSLIDTNNKPLFSTRETLVPQLRIEIEPAPAAASSAPTTGAARPVPNLGSTTTLPNSITVSGKSPNVVRIENPYIVGSDVRMNNAGVVLSKKASRLRKRDRFTITVNAPNEFILVPVQIQQELREAAGDTHWMIDSGIATRPEKKGVTSVVGSPERPEAGGVYYLPLREISWAFEGNWLRYGTEPPRILPDTIRYELSPVAPSQLPADVKTITPEQAISSGVIRGDAPNAISYAIISYLTDPDNPVGRTLYRQVPLNNAMNMFRQKEIVS